MMWIYRWILKYQYADWVRYQRESYAPLIGCDVEEVVEWMVYLDNPVQVTLRDGRIFEIHPFIHGATEVIANAL